MVDTEKRRAKIKVISVGEKPKEFEGGGSVLHFKAQEEGATNALTFETWVAQLFPTIQESVGKVLEVDVKAVQKGEYINNRVGQIYVNGEPVNKRGAGGFNQGGGDSPEKRASIEAQTSAILIKDLWVGEKLPDDDDLVYTLKTWLSRKISQVAPAPVNPSAPTVRASTPQTNRGQAEKDSSELWTGLKSNGNGKRSFGNLGQFLTACLKELNLDRTAVMANLTITKTSEIADYGKAWDTLVEYTKGA